MEDKVVDTKIHENQNAKRDRDQQHRQTKCKQQENDFLDKKTHIEAHEHPLQKQLIVISYQDI